MSNFKHIGNSIFIDGMEVPLNVFTILEPSYSQPSDFQMLTYDGENLRIRTGSVTNTISGRWADGDRFIARKNDFQTLVGLIEKEDRDVADTVDPIRDPSECRRKSYPLTSDLIVALWEHVVEKKSLSESGIEAIQEKRKAIKDKYPLKETTNGNSDNKSGTEGVLLSGTRRTRSRNKHSG